MPQRKESGSSEQDLVLLRLCFPFLLIQDRILHFSHTKLVSPSLRFRIHLQQNQSLLRMFENSRAAIITFMLY